MTAMKGSARSLRAWTHLFAASWQLASGRLIKQLDLARIWHEVRPWRRPGRKIGQRWPRDLRFLVARLEGLEPPAGCLEGSCSIRLSYRRLRAHCARCRSRLASTRDQRAPKRASEHDHVKVDAARDVGSFVIMVSAPVRVAPRSAGMSVPSRTAPATHARPPLTTENVGEISRPTPPASTLPSAGAVFTCAR